MKASVEERAATTNRAAFRHWRRAVLGPGQSEAAAVLAFAGPGFASARLAAGLLLEADLRADDRIFVAGPPPEWLGVALAVCGVAVSQADATVLVAAELPERLPGELRVVILTGTAPVAPPAGVLLTCPADWPYPSESIAD